MLLISVLSFIYLPYRLGGKVVYCFLRAIEQRFLSRLKNILMLNFSVRSLSYSFLCLDSKANSFSIYLFLLNLQFNFLLPSPHFIHLSSSNVVVPHTPVSSFPVFSPFQTEPPLCYRNEGWPSRCPCLFTLCQAAWAYSSSSVSFHKPGSHPIEGCCFPGGTSPKTWSVGLSVAVTFSSLRHDEVFCSISSHNHCQSTLESPGQGQMLFRVALRWFRGRTKLVPLFRLGRRNIGLRFPPRIGSVNGAFVSTLSHLERVQSPEFWVQSQFSASQSVRDKSREESDGGEKGKIVRDTSGEPERAWSF